MEKPTQTTLILGNKFSDIACSLIASATQTIRIIVYDWRFGTGSGDRYLTQFNHEIKMAIKRGVQIRAIVNQRIIVSQLRNINVKAKFLNTTKTVHAKVLLIDDVFLITGSHNYTFSAFNQNLEVSVLLQLDNSDNELVKFFDNLWGI